MTHYCLQCWSDVHSLQLLKLSVTIAAWLSTPENVEKMIKLHSRWSVTELRKIRPHSATRYLAIERRLRALGTPILTQVPRAWAASTSCWVGANKSCAQVLLAAWSMGPSMLITSSASTVFYFTMSNDLTANFVNLQWFLKITSSHV